MEYVRFLVSDLHLRKSWEDTGDESLQNLEWGDANANCPQDFVMFQNLKHQIALQCSKMLTNPMTLIENSLLPKGTSSASTKSPLQAEI